MKKPKPTAPPNAEQFEETLDEFWAELAAYSGAYWAARAVGDNDRCRFLWGWYKVRKNDMRQWQLQNQPVSV